MTLKQSKPYDPNARQRPAANANQRAAQRENYALFRMKGILSGLGDPVVRETIGDWEMNNARRAIQRVIDEILRKQDERMLAAGTKRRKPKFNFEDY